MSHGVHARSSKRAALKPATMHPQQQETQQPKGSEKQPNSEVSMPGDMAALALWTLAFLVIAWNQQRRHIRTITRRTAETLKRAAGVNDQFSNYITFWFAKKEEEKRSESCEQNPVGDIASQRERGYPGGVYNRGTVVVNG